MELKLIRNLDVSHSSGFCLHFSTQLVIDCMLFDKYLHHRVRTSFMQLTWLLLPFTLSLLPLLLLFCFIRFSSFYASSVFPPFSPFLMNSSSISIGIIKLVTKFVRRFPSISFFLNSIESISTNNRHYLSGVLKIAQLHKNRWIVVHIDILRHKTSSFWPWEKLRALFLIRIDNKGRERVCVCVRCRRFFHCQPN